MTLRLEVLLLILACMAVTIVPRVLPMLTVNRLRLPPSAVAWLSYVPSAVISALFFREILATPEGAPRGFLDPYFLAGWMTLALAFLTRNIILTVIAGVALFATLHWLFAG